MQKYKQNDFTLCNYAILPNLKHILPTEWVRNHPRAKPEVAFLPFERAHWPVP